MSGTRRMSSVGGHALTRRRPQDPAPAAACGAREAAGLLEPQNGGGQHSTAHEAALGPCGARGHQEAALALQAVVVSGCGPSQQGTRGVLHEEQQRPDASVAQRLRPGTERRDPPR